MPFYLNNTRVKKPSTMERYIANKATTTKTAKEAPRYSFREGLVTIANSFCVSIKKFTTLSLLIIIYAAKLNNPNKKIAIILPFVKPNSPKLTLPKSGCDQNRK
jgi:hypothetical protein